MFHAPATVRPVESPADLVARLRAAFRSGRTQGAQWRAEQLRGLRELLLRHAFDIVKAVHEDLRRPAADTRASEIEPTVADADYALAHLDAWLAPEPVDVSASFGPAARASVRAEPLGVVLVIGPWNYPLQLVLGPLVAALAAGNAVIVKPSDLAPAVSRLLARLVPAYLDASAVAVVEGGAEETAALLAERFDHVFYTGGGTVGRSVMAAAARHLTPVTLELGGKSPVFVDRDCDLSVVAARLAGTKYANAGQTCVAPDYVLTDAATGRALEAALAEAITDHYGPDPALSPAYGRIVDDRHFARLVRLLTDGRLVTGGTYAREDRYIAPTVLADITADDAVMREEIFGPILPILTVAGLDEAIDFVNDRDKPLALYAFTEDPTVAERLTTRTSSGGIGIGQPLAHALAPQLPFGGVGASGMGSYHGEFGFRTFSHRKPRLDVPLHP